MDFLDKANLIRIVKYKTLLLILFVFLISCQNTGKQTEAVSGSDSVHTDIPDSSIAVTEIPVSGQAVLALTVNALQVVKKPSGSTTELPIGMEMDQVLDVVSKVFAIEIPKPQVNSECGAGPMTMTIFENGLVLMFQKAKSNPAILEFVGWSLSESRNESKLTTMSNIGIGSTRAELESAYNVEINKTSLGMEFSTVPGGLYGIIDGPSETSKISFMWSGLSCNFR